MSKTFILFAHKGVGSSAYGDGQGGSGSKQIEDAKTSLGVVAVFNNAGVV